MDGLPLLPPFPFLRKVGYKGALFSPFLAFAESKRILSLWQNVLEHFLSFPGREENRNMALVPSSLKKDLPFSDR